MNFQLDVSRVYREKLGYDVGGYKLNTSFVTEEHTEESFIETVVKEGWPYTMVHLKRTPEETGAIGRGVKTPKHIENFISSQVITLDDDRGHDHVVSDWLNNPFFERYGFAFVESSSSTSTEQKGHAIFILDRPITDPDLYKECIKALCYKYIDKVDWLVNIDRTIYNGISKPVYVIGRTLPFETLEREVLLPWQKNEKVKLQAIYEKQNTERVAYTGNNDKLYTAYITGFVDWMINHITNKSKGENRNIAIYWAGRTVGGIRNTGWAKPFLSVLDGVEERVIDACRQNGYLKEYANNNPAEVLRIFKIGLNVGGSELDPPTVTENIQVHHRLNEVKPELTLEQKLQTQRIIEELAEEKAWIRFNRYLKEHHINSGYPEQITDHFGIGFRKQTVDQNTGEILPEAITVPYYYDSDVVSVEYRLEDGFAYDGSVSLYKVKPMFEQEDRGIIILPDSLLAIDFYLSGDNSYGVYGMPHENLNSVVLPDTDRYCIFDKNSSIEQLEELDSHGVKFVKVDSVKQMLKVVKKRDVERIASRGKRLNQVV